jgi:hypothetical protein
MPAEQQEKYKSDLHSPPGKTARILSPSVSLPSESASPPQDVSGGRQAEFDSVAIVKNPMVMTGLYSSRHGGSIKKELPTKDQWSANDRDYEINIILEDSDGDGVSRLEEISLPAENSRRTIHKKLDSGVIHENLLEKHVANDDFAKGRNVLQDRRTRISSPARFLNNSLAEAGGSMESKYADALAKRKTQNLIERGATGEKTEKRKKLYSQTERLTRATGSISAAPMPERPYTLSTNACNQK